MKLEVSIKKEKNNILRKKWYIPACIYWKHTSAKSIVVNKNLFLKIFKEAWKTTPIQLTWDINELVLIHDLQTHPVTDELIHVDFLAIKADEVVKAEVPVVLVWSSKVEKDWLGKIELLKHFILVEALPKDLPKEIIVDISVIQKPSDVIHIKDINIPKFVKVLDNIEEPLVTVVELQSDTEE